ncbi:histidine phosphatase family protein [Virgibacillus ainsalahensis]
MKKIYFVRHCTADGQHKDSPLTTIGIRQAYLLSEFFSEQNIKFDKIISSPYLRAIESIKPFAELEDIEINIDDRLTERILSEDPVDDWMDVVEHSFYHRDFALPGGESANEVIARANIVMEDIFSSKEIENIIIISHGNLLALLLNQYDPDFGFQQWKELRNPDVFLINYHNDYFSLECLWNV